MTPNEAAIVSSLQERGWTILHRGWPDFLCGRHTTRGYRVIALELKSGVFEDMRPEQWEVAKMLSYTGLPVYRYNVDGNLRLYGTSWNLEALGGGTDPTFDFGSINARL